MYWGTCKAGPNSEKTLLHIAGGGSVSGADASFSGGGFSGDALLRKQTGPPPGPRAREGGGGGGPYVAQSTAAFRTHQINEGRINRQTPCAAQTLSFPPYVVWPCRVHVLYWLGLHSRDLLKGDGVRGRGAAASILNGFARQLRHGVRKHLPP